MMNGPIDMSGERVNMPPTSGLQVIPEAAVEAASEAIHALHENPARPIGISRAELTAALEAAAPHMLAEAWDEGANFVNDGIQSFATDNPYRPAL